MRIPQKVWVGASLATAAGVLHGLRTRDRRAADRTWRCLAASAPCVPFDVQLLEGLPAPARRYFLHAIAPGTPLASAVSLQLTGALRLKPDSAWLPIWGEERLALSRGFVWRARARNRILHVTGADQYASGTGSVRFWLWGLLPAVRRTGPDVTRSSLGRMVAEAFWLPSALLPGRGKTWSALDADRAQLTLQIAGEATTLTLLVGPDGGIRRGMLWRWGDWTNDGRFAYVPFGFEVDEERTFDGYTIPTKVRVGWGYETDRYFECYRVTVQQASFE